jgi:sugar phosphate isomerase/epimerase
MRRNRSILMKLGVMSALFAGMKLEKALQYCAEVGLDAIELPVGGYPGKPFFEPDKVLGSVKLQNHIKSVLADFDLELSALAVHGNPVHPDRRTARGYHDAFVAAVQLAPKLGTNIIITFSGCPGGSRRDATPNWVTCAWPNDYQAIQKYQWDDVLVPYWAQQAKLAHKHGVKIAWEAHPGFCVYNPDTLIRLSQRAMRAAGLDSPRGTLKVERASRPFSGLARARRPGHPPVLGANLDPSHFFWQGIDPVLAARELGEAGLLFYVHAKDTELDRHEGPRHGYLDARPYDDLKRRAWVFRTVGFGHGDEFWKPFVSMLKRYGYDGVLSIEHEDALMSVNEGFEKAVAYLSDIIIEQQAGKPWWV